MLRRSSVYSLFLLVWVLSACQPRPTVIHHPQPDLAIDFSPFAEAGCPPGESGVMECSPTGPLAAFECNLIQEPASLLGALDPSYPIAMCIVRTQQPGEGTYFYNAGGLIPSFVRYVILREGTFQVIRNVAELAEVYAPIETPDEALSYALAAYDLSAYYGLERQSGYEYAVDTLEDTHVETVEGGYLVHLYHYQVFGCGPHWTSAVDVQVATTGESSLVNSQQVYRDPNEDNLCVD